VSDYPPDWWVNRFAAFVSILLAGFTADRGWVWCAFAWSIVAAGLMIWSISENEGSRP